MTLEERFELFLRRKYVVRQDERQKSMGLGYVTAEVMDLSKELANFARENQHYI